MMTKEAKVRAAVVGVGDAGSGHAGAMAHTTGYCLVGVCDAALERAEQVGKQLEVPTYPSLEHMLDAQQPDLVIVATSSDSHGELAIQALQAGAHAVVEKPMCLTTAEADAMLEAAEANGKILCVYQNRRWDEDFLTVKEVISQGFLGEIIKIESRHTAIELFIGSVGESFRKGWRVKKKYGGGVGYDWGSHLVDQVICLNPSRPVHVYGYLYGGMWGGEVDDHFESHIRFEDGSLAEVQVSNCTRLELPRWFIIGSKGTLKSEGYWRRLQLFLRSEGTEVALAPGIASKPKPFYELLHDAITAGGPVPVDPKQSRQVTRIIEVAMLSSERGEAIAL